MHEAISSNLEQEPLRRWDGRTTLTAADMVRYVDAILAEAPQKGTVRNVYLLRYGIPEQRFDAWQGSYDDLRERAGLPSKEVKKALINTQHTTEKVAGVFGWGHDEVGKPPQPLPRIVRPSAQANQARTMRRKPDVALDAGLQEELDALLLDIPTWNEKTKRKYTNVLYKKILRVRYLYGLVSPTRREHFMRQYHFADAQIIDWRKNIGYDGSHPLGPDDLQEKEMEDQQPSALTREEEQELTQLLLNTVIPPFVKGEKRHIKEGEKQKIFKIGMLLRKKGERFFRAFMHEHSLQINFFQSIERRKKFENDPASRVLDTATDAGGSEEEGDIPSGAPENEEAIDMESDSHQESAADDADIPSGDLAETERNDAPMNESPTTGADEEANLIDVIAANVSTQDPTDIGSSTPSPNGHLPSPTSPMNVYSSSAEAITTPFPEKRNGVSHPSATNVRINTVRIATQTLISPKQGALPSWVHATSQSEAANANDLDAEKQWQRNALRNANLVMDGDPGMAKIWEEICNASKGDSPVLIRGEPGVGKEPLSEAVHILHKRADALEKVYWKINCASISPALADSELFGHVKGAFTGADKDHEGAFGKVRNGGTILLDEVGDMPWELQAKLLRTLENRTYLKVGTEKESTLTNVKIVASTNRPLEQMIKDGTFRKDLFDRLSAHEITVPPLSERGMQHRIALIGHFLTFFSGQYTREIGMTQAAFEWLVSEEAQYPANVRGLRNHLERAFIRASQTAGKKVDIDLEHLLQTIKRLPEEKPRSHNKSEIDLLEDTVSDTNIDTVEGGANSPANISGDILTINVKDRTLDDVCAQVRAALLKATLSASNGNQSEAARKLDITRSYARKIMHAHGLIVSGVVVEKDSEREEPKEA